MKPTPFRRDPAAWPALWAVLMAAIFTALRCTSAWFDWPSPIWSKVAFLTSVMAVFAAILTWFDTSHKPKMGEQELQEAIKSLKDNL